MTQGIWFLIVTAIGSDMRNMLIIYAIWWFTDKYDTSEVES